ncbi:hypothetical protein DACRYDRAFT_101210 [Dacryopinax primogenitus]|uniref:Uncharacterized protein n=1 Tax=Dacryopinax primogenitus (strain DJM 731) TaxID=1858805 RepID=M5G123_DACPD|nr:uncharacterized protein DACRYDRAFT_101210 [Dacryopinax primogenitus]EJT99521.1 hypothetical protein DACRYDRAFT_101210 [Dacryopinax primogenitus]
MSTSLNLFFEPNQKPKKRVYHKLNDRGDKTKSFDLDTILGVDNGKPRWGAKGICGLLGDVQLKGSNLKAQLFIGSTGDRPERWIPVEFDLSQHIKLADTNGKTVLESYGLPTIPQEQIDALQQQNKMLLGELDAEIMVTEAAKKAAAERTKVADEVIKASEESEKEKAKWRADNKEHDDRLAEDAAHRDRRHKEHQQEVQGDMAISGVLHRAREEELQRRAVDVKHEADEMERLAKKKTVEEQDVELEIAASRLSIEQQLSLAQKEIAEQASSISARQVYLSKTYADHAWLNGEIKERDLKMSLMFQENSELYRELSQSHDRFSVADKQRLVMTQEEKRILSSLSRLEEDCKRAAIELAAAETEFRLGEREVKKTSAEKSRFESKCTTLEGEMEWLQKENLVLKAATVDLRAEHHALNSKFHRAETTIAGNKRIIEHSETWKAFYEKEVESVMREISEVSAAMSILEIRYQETAQAFRIAHLEKEKLQAELVNLKYSKTASESRILVVEQTLQVTKTELSQLSKSFEEKENELRAMAAVRTVLERRLTELSLSHTRERNVTRSVSERLFQVQGSVAEDVDWMYDIRDDLTEESKYLYLHHLHRAATGPGGAVIEGELDQSGLSRLPSYRSALNSPAGNPDKTVVPEIVADAVAPELKIAEIAAISDVKFFPAPAVSSPNDFQAAAVPVIPNPAPILA